MYLESVRELLRKQKLVDSVTRAQAGAHPQLVESLNERQHVVELETFMARLGVADIVEIFAELNPEEAAMLWARVPASRTTDVLWDMPDDLRERLEEAVGPRPSDSRVSVFELSDGRIRQSPIKGRKDLEGKKPIWIDLLNASARATVLYRRVFTGSNCRTRATRPNWKCPAGSRSTKARVEPAFELPAGPGRQVAQHSGWVLSARRHSVFASQRGSSGVPPAAPPGGNRAGLCL